jgi:hypothetical protein
VTYITGHFVAVYFVLFDLPIIFVTVTTFGQPLYIVPVAVIGAAVPVQIPGGMAFHAVHIMFGVVDIPLTGLPPEFVAHPASMACYALVGLVGFLIEPVPVYETAPGKVGTADVTFSTAGVATVTVVAHSLIQQR